MVVVDQPSKVNRNLAIQSNLLIPPPPQKNSQSHDFSLLENIQFGTTQLQFMVLCWVGFEKQEGLQTSFWEPCTLCLVRPHQVSLHNSLQACETDGSENRSQWTCDLPCKQTLLAILILCHQLQDSEFDSRGWLLWLTAQRETYPVIWNYVP